MNTVYILLGSDIENRVENLARAKTLIVEQLGNIISASSIYETEPWHMESFKWFLNQCIKIETSLDAQTSMHRLLDIEMTLGRVRTEQNDGYASRIIDLDILYFNNEIANSTDLVIPHPKLHLRKFVLIPLNEIEAQYKHPTLHATNQELLDQCPDKTEVKLYVV